jgi:hypothetical protein
MREEFSVKLTAVFDLAMPTHFSWVTVRAVYFDPFMNAYCCCFWHYFGSLRIDSVKMRILSLP